MWPDAPRIQHETILSDLQISLSYVTVRRVKEVAGITSGAFMTGKLLG